jgi:hypothetical protein
MRRWFVPVVGAGLWMCLVSPVLGWWPAEVIELKEGHQVTGEVVAEKPQALFVDIGFDIIRIPRDQIVRRGKVGETAASITTASGPIDSDPTGFFATESLKPTPVKELVQTYGEAVISIETPSGKGSGFVLNGDGYAVTNNHVIEGETRIAAVLYQNVPNGLARRRIENVEIVALNPFVDLALLKLPPQKDLKLGHVVLGSLEDLHAGDGDQSRQLRRPALQSEGGGHRGDQHEGLAGGQPRLRDPDQLRERLPSEPGRVRVRQGQPQHRVSIPGPSPATTLGGASRDASFPG